MFGLRAGGFKPQYAAIGGAPNDLFGLCLLQICRALPALKFLKREDISPGGLTSGD